VHTRFSWRARSFFALPLVVAAAVIVPLITMDKSSPVDPAARQTPSLTSRAAAAIPPSANVTEKTIESAVLPPKSVQVSVLAAALAKMEKDYSSYVKVIPGPSDVLDYGVGSLWLKGIDGAGTTIAVLEGWNLPGIASDVDSFDKLWGLPNPVIKTIYPSGDSKLPASCPPGMVELGDYGSCSGWGGELKLDVLAAHLMAPYAQILISVTPADSQIADDAASNVAPYEMMRALETIAGKHLANVVSISTGTAESSYKYGTSEISAQTPGLLAAAVAGVPICEGTGDRDVVQTLPSYNGTVLTTGPATAAWDDSPWVTATGGTTPNLSSTGKRLGPDPIWNTGPWGEGAGFSSVIPRPSYQAGVASITKSSWRSVPDLVMDARIGTSEAGPLLCGVLDLATQENKANLGPINPVVYGVLGPKGGADGISDVVSGNNTYTPTEGNKVTGYTATKGFDVASGWGTIYAPSFVPALVAATKAAKQESAARTQAAQALAALSSDVHLSSTTVAAGGTSQLTASGYLPLHPVQLTIDGHLIGTLTASKPGRVAYRIDPSTLKLAKGPHKLVLTGMLLMQTIWFTSN
jgi:subtilase family serine protease